MKNKTEIIPVEQSVSTKVGDLKVGYYLIYNKDEVYKITKMVWEYYDNEDLEEGDNEKYLDVHYIDEEGNEDTVSLNSIENYYEVLDTDIDIHDFASKIMSRENTITDFYPDEKNESASNDLMIVDKSLYEMYLQKSEKKRKEIKSIEALINSRVKAMKSHCYDLIKSTEKLVKKLESIIFTLTIYGGIEETIETIQTGILADDSEPIHLMQERKYMDEEVGDPENGGLDHTDLKVFYKWLLTKCKFLDLYYYELLVPYSKSVRVIKVRREDKYPNTYIGWQIEENKLNNKTIVIIRNGENISVIDSQLDFREKLFPDETEIMDLYESLNDDNIWKDRRGDTKEEIIDNTIHDYKQGMILMQGLVDRTTLFGQVAGKVSFLTNKSVEEGSVKFVYENDDNLITDGTETFTYFLNKNGLKKGDRILFRPKSWGSYELRYRLFKLYFKDEYCRYPDPKAGVYKIEQDKKTGKLYFKYNPKDKLWKIVDGYYEESIRKNSLSFEIEERDNFWCPFDIVKDEDLDWIEAMQYDRRERKKYSSVIPLLKGLREEKLKEIEEEKPFTNMLQSSLKIDYKLARSYVYWWKNKNMHKRTLSVDDLKAIRMITKRHKKLSKENSIILTKK